MRLEKLTPTLIVSTLALLPAACGGQQAPSSEMTAAAEDPSDNEANPQPRTVTYYDDVLPIFANSCMAGCHSDGGVGPFVVDDLEEAQAWASAIAASVTARTMPPFGVNNDGSCNTFEGANWLSEEEIETINAWLDTGMQAGDPSKERPVVPEARQLQANEILDVTTPANYVPVPETYPGGEFEDYQCFLVELPADRDRFLVGYDVIPGNPATVHHVLGFEVDPNFFGNRQRIENLDADSPDQPGWDCLAAAGEGVIPVGVPVSWAPGTDATNFPEGTGIRIEAGNVLVIQMHYNLVNDTEAGQTIVKLGLADEVEREAHQTLADPFLDEGVLGNVEPLAPGEPSVTYRWDLTLAEALYLEDPGDTEVEVLGVLPHMHKRGRRMSINFEIDGNMRCGADVDRYDFNWQLGYFLEQPLTMRLDDRVHVLCDWDTTGDTQPVLPGFGTEDEMCLLGLYAVKK